MDVLENLFNIILQMKASIHNEAVTKYSIRELTIFIMIGLMDIIIYICLLNSNVSVCIEIFSIYVIVVSALSIIVFFLEILKIKNTEKTILMWLVIFKYILLIGTIPFSLVFAIFNINYNTNNVVKRLLYFILSFSAISLITVISVQQTITYLHKCEIGLNENIIPLYFGVVLVYILIIDIFAIAIIKVKKDDDFAKILKDDVKMSKILLLVLLMCITVMFPNYCENTLNIIYPNDLNTALSLYTIFMLLLDKKKEIYKLNKDNANRI